MHPEALKTVTEMARAGLRWTASDEGVLAASLGTDGFTRNSNETVTQPDQRSQLQARLGEVQLRMGRRDEAVKTLRDALSANPDNTLAQQLLVRAGPVSP